ncbi:MAG: hypothetical protein JWP87_6240 [Labilithrix sp.]|nr:hypothetical protein [Labilithrix sp.]
MLVRVRTLIGLVGLVFALAACERHDVDVEVERPAALSRAQRSAVQQTADLAFRDARKLLPTLPAHISLVVRHGKDVIPETGENGTTASPAQVFWTVDPDRDLASVVRQQLRATLFHELHHLARANAIASEGRAPSRALMDTVVTEGMATAFERDFGGVTPPWAEPPPDPTAWTRELLAQPATASHDHWLFRHPDGRRWIGMRVGTFLVDGAAKASGRTSAQLVATSTDEVLRLADVR